MSEGGGGDWAEMAMDGDAVVAMVAAVRAVAMAAAAAATDGDGGGDGGGDGRRRRRGECLARPRVGHVAILKGGSDTIPPYPVVRPPPAA